MTSGSQVHARLFVSYLIKLSFFWRLRLQRDYNPLIMSLIPGYSSDEDNDSISHIKDAFNLSSLPSAKRPRVEVSAPPRTAFQAAPDVLAEVSTRLKPSLFANGKNPRIL